jgi:hypothetical protein
MLLKGVGEYMDLVAQRAQAIAQGEYKPVDTIRLHDVLSASNRDPKLVRSHCPSLSQHTNHYLKQKGKGFYKKLLDVGYRTLF